MLPIGKTARQVGMPVKTVRYYDDISLVNPHGRSAKGYRLYNDTDIRKLLFIKHARQFGFSIEECRDLLGLYEDRDRSSAEVKNLAVQHLARLKNQMAQLQALHDELAHLADACQGNQRPDCPILDNLAGLSGASK